MAKKLMLVALLGLLGITGLIGYGEPPKETKPEKEKPNPVMLVAKDNNEFAFDLYSQLASKEGNLFFSPFSISTALAMTYAGARNNTAVQMAKTLHYNLKDNELHQAFADLMAGLKKNTDYQLNIANALWGQTGYKFVEEFVNLNKKYYKSGLTELDFNADTEKARLLINKWVEDQTKDKIKELIKKGILTQDTRFVLTNAIYFKGNWASQFKKEATKDVPFKLVDKKPIDIPMMTQTADFWYSEGDGLKILSLPYVKNELDMVILLPDKDDGIKDMEKELTITKLNVWLKKLYREEVKTYLPKFTFTSEFEMKGTLSTMGMPDAFSPNADFSGMTGRKDFMISEVIHKAFVDVNEEGTEAAAATAVGMIPTPAASSKPKLFRADHPFIFLIRNTKTDSILFIGRVMNPKG